jgi:hypothetical protein
MQFAKRTLPLVIPKPALPARNPLAAGSETADSSRDRTALRNDKPLGFSKVQLYRMAEADRARWQEPFRMTPDSGLQTEPASGQPFIIEPNRYPSEA